MPDRDDPWHVMHTVETSTGTTGYQINGPACFLVFGDEVDGLIALLHGVKVDDAIRRLGELDESVGTPIHPGQGTIPGIPDFAVGVPVTDEIIPPHTRYIEDN